MPNKDKTIFPYLDLVCLIAVLIAAVSLLLQNGTTTAIIGAETDFLFAIQNAVLTGVDEVAGGVFPHEIGKSIYQRVGLDTFSLRLPGIVVLLAGWLGFFWWGRKIFGLQTVLITILVWASSLMLVSLSKFASGDPWLFSFQTVGFLFLVMFLKQPVAKWAAFYWIVAVLGVWVHPLSMAVWSLAGGGVLRFMHPKGRNLDSLYLWLGWPILLISTYMLGQLQVAQSGFFLAYGQLNAFDYLAFSLIALLPWVGFLAPGIMEMFRNLKRKEEMAVISLAWLLAGLGSFSLALQAVLGFLVARQVIRFFKEGYPYASIVKGVSVLAIILVFCTAIVGLIAGYKLYGGDGFQRGMATGAAYWIPALAGVIGLYMKNPKWVIGGMAGSGLMAVLVGWLLLGPMVEKGRALPKKLETGIAAKEIPVPAILGTKGQSLSIRQINLYLASGGNSARALPAQKVISCPDSINAANLIWIAEQKTKMELPDTLCLEPVPMPKSFDNFPKVENFRKVEPGLSTGKHEIKQNQ